MCVTDLASFLMFFFSLLPRLIRDPPMFPATFTVKGTVCKGPTIFRVKGAAPKGKQVPGHIYG